jgi:branched-chain amino acid transport system ATP-binding protein
MLAARAAKGPGRLKASRLTMIVAEQSVRFVSGLGDRVYILEKGMVRYHGSMIESLAEDEVRLAHPAP